MRCKRAERRISDDLDGALGARKRAGLSRHLRDCPRCRFYAASQGLLRDKARGFEKPVPSPDFWNAFNRRLRAGLEAERTQDSAPPVPGRRWAWAGSALALALVVASLVFLRNGAGNGLAVSTFSFEDSLTQIYQAIGEDDDLESSFNQALLVLLGEVFQDAEEIGLPGAEGGLSIWEGISEDELGWLEEEVDDEKG